MSPALDCCIRNGKQVHDLCATAPACRASVTSTPKQLLSSPARRLHVRTAGGVGQVRGGLAHPRRLLPQELRPLLKGRPDGCCSHGCMLLVL